MRIRTFKQVIWLALAVTLLTRWAEATPQLQVRDTPEGRRTRYYHQGEIQARKDYSGAGAWAEGFSSGLLGPLGWGFGIFVYGRASRQAIQVPQRYTYDLEPEQKRDFEQGYAGYIEKTRKVQHVTGAGMGCLAFFVLLNIVYSELR